MKSLRAAPPYTMFSVSTAQQSWGDGGDGEHRDGKNELISPRKRRLMLESGVTSRYVRSQTKEAWKVRDRLKSPPSGVSQRLRELSSAVSVVVTQKGGL